MEIELPAMESRALTLEPRVERGTEAGAAEPLQGAVSVGGPITIPLTPERLEADPELRALVEDDAEHRYHLLHLAGTFIPAEDEPLQRVWVKVELWGPDPEYAPRPIAWSMKPEVIEDEGGQSSSLTLGADLKVLKAGIERGSSQVSHEVSLQALFVLQSNPTWVLERTEAAEIRGSQRFVLVVRSPREATGRGEVEIGALVRRRRFGVISYNASLDGLAAPLEFELGD